MLSCLSDFLQFYLNTEMQIKYGKTNLPRSTGMATFIDKIAPCLGLRLPSGLRRPKLHILEFKPHVQLVDITVHMESHDVGNALPTLTPCTENKGSKDFANASA